MKTISVYVSEKAYKEFQVRAGRSGRPVAELIRQAMANYLEQDDSKRSILDIPPFDSGKALKMLMREESS